MTPATYSSPDMPINPQYKQQSLRVDSQGRLLVAGGGVDTPSYQGAFAGKPTAADAGAGATIVITDVGTSWVTFRSDGTYWRPLNGRALLFQRCGTIASPVATNVHSGSFAVFAQPTMLIPGGLVAPGSKLVISAFVRRSAAGGSPASANFTMFWNAVDGTPAGQVAGTTAMSVTTGTHCLSYTEAMVVATTGYVATTNAIPAGAVATGAADRMLTTTADSFVYCGTSGIFETGATFQLLGMTVELVG